MTSPTSLVALAAAGLIWLLSFQARPHGPTNLNPDAQDYAHLGRQPAQGRGSTTKFMPWNGLEFLRRRGADLHEWPNITRFPLVPALMGGAFAVLGPIDGAVHLPGAVAYLLAVVGAGLLGSRVYGTWSGSVAALAVACLPVLVWYSLRGLTELLLGALLVLALTCLVHAAGRPRLLLAAGALMGLALLDRYDAAVFNLPILALWPPGERDRVRRAGLFLLVQGLVILPWSAFLFASTGDPLFNLQPASIAAQASSPAGGLGWYQPLYITPWEALRRDPARAGQVFLEQFSATPRLLRSLLEGAWPLLPAGALACALDLIRSVGGLGRLLVAALILRALTASALGLNVERHFVPLIPLLVVVAFGRLDRALQSLPLDRFRPVGASTIPALGRCALALAMILPSLWSIGPFLQDHVDSPYVEARPDNLAELARVVGPEQLVASNVPWSVAWQADRRAVPLPPTPQQTAELGQRYGLTIEAVYLAGQVVLNDAPASWREWDELRSRGAPPPGYELAETFPNGGRLYLRASP